MAGEQGLEVTRQKAVISASAASTRENRLQEDWIRAGRAKALQCGRRAANSSDDAFRAIRN